MILVWSLSAISNELGEITCYENSVDRDGDGYASSLALSVVIFSDKKENEKENLCPSGYTRYGNDCNDFDSNIHPNQLETAFNGIDDNCNNEIDETEYIYWSNGFKNKEKSFSIRTKINSIQVNRLKRRYKIFAKVKYRNVTELKFNQTSYIPVSIKKHYYNGIGHYYGSTVNLKGLSKTSVYETKVEHYYRVGRTLKKFNISDSESYYSTTTDQEKTLSQARTSILLLGFKQYFNQKRGRVGKMGSPWVNGTHYGAREDEAWCTEFYAWVSSIKFKGIKNIDNTRRMEKYFGGNFNRVYNLEDLSGAHRGDWLAYDWEGDGKKDHSAMLLGIRADGKIITLEGNVGHMVKIEKRSIDVIYGYGHLATSKLK